MAAQVTCRYRFSHLVTYSTRFHLVIALVQVPLSSWENRDFVFFTSNLWMELECSVPIRHPMAVCLMDSGSWCRVWYKVTLINTAMVLHWLEVSCHSVICSGKFQSFLNTSPLSTPSWYKLRTPYCHQAAIQSISPTDFFLYCLCSLSTYGHLLEFLK